MRLKCKYITMSGKCQKHSTPEVNEYCLGSPCEDYEGYGTKEVVPRYIDADALILALETQDYSGAPDTLEDWTPQDMTKAEIADINNAPTIDAEPVRHGKWDDKRVAFFRKCSECGATVKNNLPDVFLDYDIRDLHYCPNCGAKMEGCE